MRFGVLAGALSLALRACPSPKTAWGRDLGSLRSRLFGAREPTARTAASPLMSAKADCVPL